VSYRAFGGHREDPEGRERPEHSDQRLGLYATLNCERVDGNICIRLNPIGKSDVSNETQHPGYLKSPHQQLQRGPVTVCIVQVCHGGSFCLEVTAEGDHFIGMPAYLRRNHRFCNAKGIDSHQKNFRAIGLLSLEARIQR
jgi:hypothetical protein